jgi:hypothetical protein
MSRKVGWNLSSSALITAMCGSVKNLATCISLPETGFWKANALYDTNAVKIKNIKMCAT